MRWMVMGLMIVLGGWFAQSMAAAPADTPPCCCEQSMSHCSHQQQADHACCQHVDCHCDQHCAGPHMGSALIMAGAPVVLSHRRQPIGAQVSNTVPSPYLKTPAKPPRV